MVSAFLRIISAFFTEKVGIVKVILSDFKMKADKIMKYKVFIKYCFLIFCDLALAINGLLLVVEKIASQ